MNAMLKYRGGKTREIPYIQWYIPRFSGRYIEPFFGGGALYFHLEPKQAIINDINSALMCFYRSVRDDYKTLREELDHLERLYKHNRSLFEALKAEHPDKKVEDPNEVLYYDLRSQFNGLSEKTFSDAALYYYINKTAYSGMIRYNANGQFNVPYGRYSRLNTQGVTSKHEALLKRTELYNTDYSLIFDMCKKDDFVFLDPPYDCTFNDYGNAKYKDGFNENEHRRLAKDFFDLPCKALMVIGRTPLIDELYGEHIMFEYPKNYAVNIRNRFKAEATHAIITNYSEAELDESKIKDYAFSETKQIMLFEKDTRYGKDK